MSKTSLMRLPDLLALIDVLVRKFKVKTNYLEYYYNKVVSTLTRYKKLCSPINGNDQTQDATKTLLYHTKFCEKAYQRLIKKKASTPLKSQGKWLAEDLIGNETVNWESTYSLPFWCSKETKLREFQFKLLHKRIATNDFLYKMELNSLIPAPSVEKQRKTWFTYFGAVNTLTPFGKTAING